MKYWSEKITTKDKSRSGGFGWYKSNMSKLMLKESEKVPQYLDAISWNKGREKEKELLGVKMVS